MSDPRNISIEEYDYPLPAGLIAQYPLHTRDASRLLVYNKGNVSDTLFTRLPEALQDQSLLVFNNSRVIRARFVFYKSSGARIEIFCLEPVDPTGNFQLAFGSAVESYWKCYIGNLKKWKNGTLNLGIAVKGKKLSLLAEKIRSDKDTVVVRFTWDDTGITFAEVMEKAGHIPLPPYIARVDEEIDTSRYQTIFAREQGSVAAPTAGLHFTGEILSELRMKGFASEQVTLHVGAGTFKPVGTDRIGNHDMHYENYTVHRNLILKLIEHAGKPTIPVGTTSMRTLESLYWLGVRLVRFGQQTELVTDQWEPYSDSQENISTMKALEALLDFMTQSDQDILHASTGLMIAPGYNFRLCSGLITNFHLPKSTLLLLVAALLGSDWKRVYRYAIEKHFRFLSYGDSCLFMP